MRRVIAVFTILIAASSVFAFVRQSPPPDAMTLTPCHSIATGPPFIATVQDFGSGASRVEEYAQFPNGYFTSATLSYGRGSNTYNSITCYLHTATLSTGQDVIEVYYTNPISGTASVAGDVFTITSGGTTIYAGTVEWTDGQSGYTYDF